MQVNFDFNLQTERHKIHLEDLTNQEFDAIRILLLTLKREFKTLESLNEEELSLKKVIEGIAK